MGTSLKGLTCKFGAVLQLTVSYFSALAACLWVLYIYCLYLYAKPTVDRRDSSDSLNRVSTPLQYFYLGG